MPAPMRLIRLSTLPLILISTLAATQNTNPVLGPSENDRQTLEAISPDSMKGHLSFLASDLLEGRDTPSRGLDLAAEYIAAQFRRAGLEPGVGSSFFQETTYTPRGSSEASKVRNVVGVLRGSDPVLKDTYIIVSAHYDHLGVRPNMEGDNIFNGANDDGSGTVGVIELATTLSKLKTRPKRSIVFMTFYGEEKGMLGSRFYGANPVFPLKNTIAQINLEQIGRTDDSEAPRVSAATMTGYDFSEIGSLFNEAGKYLGVPATKHPRFSDSYFSRSDNQSLANVGIPAHTISVAFSYPDYHGAADHWDKVDYANMAKIVKMVGAGLITLARSTKEPKWNESNSKTTRYVEAWKKLHEAKGG